MKKFNETHEHLLLKIDYTQDRLHINTASYAVGYVRFFLINVLLSRICVLLETSYSLMMLLGVALFRYDAVCLFVNDTASAEVIQTLSLGGVGLIAMRCAGFGKSIYLMTDYELC